MPQLQRRQDSIRSGYMSDQESKGVRMLQQMSVESANAAASQAAAADMRLCYLTSSEMSDDDRMSLTTAISDDDEIDDDASYMHNLHSPSGGRNYRYGQFEKNNDV